MTRFTVWLEMGLTATFVCVVDMLLMGYGVILHVNSVFSLVMTSQGYKGRVMKFSGESPSVVVKADGSLATQGILVQFENDDVMVPHAGPLDALA